MLCHSLSDSPLYGLRVWVDGQMDIFKTLQTKNNKTKGQMEDTPSLLYSPEVQPDNPTEAQVISLKAGQLERYLMGCIFSPHPSSPSSNSSHFSFLFIWNSFLSFTYGCTRAYTDNAKHTFCLFASSPRQMQEPQTDSLMSQDALKSKCQTNWGTCQLPILPFVVGRIKLKVPAVSLLRICAGGACSRLNCLPA